MFLENRVKPFFFSQVWKRNFIIFQITLLREYLLGNEKLAGKRTQAPDLGNDSVVFSKLQWDRSGPRMLFYVYCEVSFALLLFLCKPAQQQKEKKKKRIIMRNHSQNCFERNSRYFVPVRLKWCYVLQMGCSGNVLSSRIYPKTGQDQHGDIDAAHAEAYVSKKEYKR